MTTGGAQSRHGLGRASDDPTRPGRPGPSVAPHYAGRTREGQRRRPGSSHPLTPFPLLHISVQDLKRPLPPQPYTNLRHPPKSSTTLDNPPQPQTTGALLYFVHISVVRPDNAMLWILATRALSCHVALHQLKMATSSQAAKRPPPLLPTKHGGKLWRAQAHPCRYVMSHKPTDTASQDPPQEVPFCGGL